MKGKAIICVGNRLVENDALGGCVFDALALRRDIPSDTDLIDGGLLGLELLTQVENRQRVIFVDAIDNDCSQDDVAVLDRSQAAALATGFGHAAGLPYLFAVLPSVCPEPLPEILLVGASGPATPALVAKVVERCLEVAVHGQS